MSVGTAIIDYAKQLIDGKTCDQILNGKNAEDQHIGEILYDLGYKILAEETEAMSRKYEAEYESGQSD